jgi:hypothetical protein
VTQSGRWKRDFLLFALAFANIDITSLKRIRGNLCECKELSI